MNESNYEIWKNDHGIRINMACFSCKHAQICGMDNKFKHCEVTDHHYERTHCCSLWKPLPVYTILGGARNLKGALMVPGQVKTKSYFTWLANNILTLKGGLTEYREVFKKENPFLKLFWNEKNI